MAFGKGAPSGREEGIQRHQSGRVSGMNCQKLRFSKEGANDTGGDIMYERWRCRERQKDKKTDAHRSVADKKTHTDSSSHLFIQQTLSAQ